MARPWPGHRIWRSWPAPRGSAPSTGCAPGVAPSSRVCAHAPAALLALFQASVGRPGSWHVAVVESLERVRAG
eukprot:6864595-Lingulodinium_polyedra.AAC.1